MIHSLSGGVIHENGVYTFAKVEVDGLPCWYLAREKVEAGDCVIVPFGKRGELKRGKVLRVESCSEQTAPCPMNRVREIEQVLRENE